jgi:hypothetical protein
MPESNNNENDDRYDPDSSVSFAVPTVDANATSEPATDQALTAASKLEEQNNGMMNLTEGVATTSDVESFCSNPRCNCSNRGMTNPYLNGRTSTSVTPATRDVAHSLQNRTTNHIYPYDTNYDKYTAYNMHNNVLASANPPTEAKRQLPSTYRLGNNSDVNRDMKPYTNPNNLNSGPFNINIHDC